MARAETTELQLKETLSVPVPVALADKLLWHTQAQTLSSPDTQIPVQDTLAHIEHAADHELADAGTVTLADINTKLASLQGVLDASIGTILSVNFCSLDGVRSLHVMVGNKDNPTSLFILPKDTALDGVPTTQSTSATVDFANAKVLIVGEVAETVQSLKAQIKAHLKFSLHD